MLTGHAVPTDPGGDAIANADRRFIFWVQVLARSQGAIAFGWFVVRPWRSEGRMTTVGMLYLCWLTLFF